jgi:hypothetical protein
MWLMLTRGVNLYQASLEVLVLLKDHGLCELFEAIWNWDMFCNLLFFNPAEMPCYKCDKF